MAIVNVYEGASGERYDRCSFLGLRYEERHGYSPGESEWWVMITRPGPTGITAWYQYGATRWYTGIWRSPRNVTYVVDAQGEVHVNRDLEAPDAHRAWTRHRLGVPLLGVWGLDDRCVFAWGGTVDGRFPVFRWDGAGWAELPPPGFDVRSIHGIAPDRVWAGGIQGALARWDGAAWRRLPSPVNEHVVSMFVVSADEQYATGHRGALLEGSAAGWGVVARGPIEGMPLHAVAKWKGELWVGGGQLGLFRRAGTTNRLELVKPELQATALDARGDLVINCLDLIAGTADGKAFFFTAEDFLVNRRVAKALGDLTP